MPLETLGRRQRAVAGIGRVEGMYLAVLSRDVENADLLAGAVFVGVCAHNDRRAGRERLPAEAIHQRLRNREAFSFDQNLFAFGAFGLDDQIHMRVLPVEPRDRPFDQYLLRRVKHRLAVMRERRRAEGRCDRENKDSSGSDSHLETSRQATLTIPFFICACPLRLCAAIVCRFPTLKKKKAYALRLIYT